MPDVSFLTQEQCHVCNHNNL